MSAMDSWKGGMKGSGMKTKFSAVGVLVCVVVSGCFQLLFSCRINSIFYLCKLGPMRLRCFGNSENFIEEKLINLHYSTELSFIVETRWFVNVFCFTFVAKYTHFKAVLSSSFNSNTSRWNKNVSLLLILTIFISIGFSAKVMSTQETSYFLSSQKIFICAFNSFPRFRN